MAKTLQEIFARKEVIKQAPQTTLQKLASRLPEPIRKIGRDLKEGLVGRGQVVDLAGEFKFDTGFAGFFRPFGLGKPKEQKVFDRVDLLKPLVERGQITQQRADEIATSVLKPTGLSAIQQGQPSKVDIELTPEEKKALRPVRIEETLDKVFGALDVVSFGLTKPLTRTVTQKIARSTDPNAIFSLLKKELPDLSEQNLKAFSDALVQVDNADDVQTVLNRTSFAIQEGKKAGAVPKRPLAEILAPKTELSTSISQAKASGQSFDEWVKGQNTVFHGADQRNIDAMNKSGVRILTPEEKIKLPSTGGGNVGISMTTDRATAQNYSSALGNKNVGEFYLSPKAKIKDISTYIDDTYTPAQIEQLQKQGYDAIRSTASESEVRILSDKAVKTRSQLKAEWDGVNVATKKPALPVYKGETDLSTKLLKDLEGKSTVSKQYILDATNRPELKQAERDLIRGLVQGEGNTINVQDFANKVKSELLPLEPHVAMGTRYEGVILSDELRGPVANYSERVYNSPIKTSARDVHFPTDGKINEGYFAHSRIEDLPVEGLSGYQKRNIKELRSQGVDIPQGGTRRVIEIQSDLFQKGRLEGEVGSVDFRLRQLRGNLSSKVSRGEMSMSEMDRVLANEAAFAQPEKIARQAELSKLEPYRNTWHERVIREEVKQAAIDGKTKLQFPTGETAMKIEGLGDEARFVINPEQTLQRRATINDLKVGREVAMEGDTNNGWIITDVLGDGKFKAVPKEHLESALEKAGVNSKDFANGINYLEHHNDTFFGRWTETFDISGKVDTNNPIYKFYEKEVGRYLTNKYGAKQITDPQGVKWWEVDVSPQMAKAPVEAFGGVAGIEQDEEGNMTLDPTMAVLGIAGMSFARRAKVIKQELAKTEKLLTSIRETPTEFSLGKRAMQERYIRLASEPVLELLSKADITQTDSKVLFNAFENPDKYQLTDALKAKGGDEILAEARELNRILTDEKLSKEVIERAWDDDTYMRTILETLTGEKPSAEQIARLRNASQQNFRDQLITNQGGFSGKLKQKLKTEAREYPTADERDVVLAQFDLRTKRDFVTSLEENIRITSKVTSNREFNDAIRSVAREGVYNDKGVLVKRSDIKEVYDPVAVADKRLEVKNRASDQISKIIDEAKEQRIFTDSEAKLIKNRLYEDRKTTIKTLKESQEYALDDLDNAINYTKGQLDLLSASVRAEKQAILSQKKKAIDAIRDKAKREINEYYGSISTQRGKLIDEGFKDLGTIQGAEPLRGIMVKEKDYKAVEQLVNELKPSSAEDFARSIKMLQATLDLFQIPQALRSSIAINGFLKGGYDWIKAVAVATKTSERAIIEASEFVQLGRHKDFDIDIWNKTFKSIEKEQSNLMKVLTKVGEKVDSIPVLSKIKEIIGKVGILETYQWQTLMIPLKVQSWQRKVAQLKRAFPEVDERTIKIEAGRAIDDYFGGQNWDKLMARSPSIAGQRVQRTGRILIFAMDYLTSILRTLRREARDVIRVGDPRGDIARKAFLRKVIYGLGFANAISYMLNGKSTFENDDPNQWYKIQTPIEDGKGNPYYLDMMGNWGQTWNLMNRPIDALRGKISGPGRVGATFVSEGKFEIADSLNPIPFSWRNIAETIYNEATGKEPQAQMPASIPEGAMLTVMEFMGLAGTFSGGKSRRQTVARMIENEDFNPETVWRIITGQDMLTNKERIIKLIDSEGIRTAYDWEKDQKKEGNLSEQSYPTREALKSKYGISGTITEDANIRKMKLMTKTELNVFLDGYSDSTVNAINAKLNTTQSSGKSLGDIFR